MSVNRAAAFPQELLELIVDYISLDSEDGHYALCSCLLVSRILFWRSRIRLFSHVVLRTYNPPRSEGLRRLLESKGVIRDYPDLIHCIKSFKIVSISFQTETAGDDNDVSAILSMLASTKSVQALHLESVHHIGTSVCMADWKARHAIHDICLSPSVEDLELTNITSVPFDMCDLWNITKLSVNPNTEFIRMNSPFYHLNLNNHSTSLRRPTLRSFTYTFNSEKLLPDEWLYNPSPFSGLRDLSVGLGHRRPYPQVTSQLNKMLDISSTTLQTLIIRIDDPEYRIFTNDSLSLRNLTTLRQLQFNITGYFGLVEGRILRVLGGIQDVREALKSFEDAPTTLDRIVVLYDIRVETGVDVGFKSDSDWQELGDLLLSKRFDSVKRVEIVVLAKFRQLDIGTVESPPFLENFPAVWQSKYPRVVFTVHKISEDNRELYNRIISS
ncbi:hypothetical protein CPB83DRAFT_865356 [Crepidotus variabilis]|uniref:Uncharacterized protein n=1 Tax=Crepidotus variabilis TaxID=179855 RepID=A0A9P6E370_9AGAR|nr:hypothetical protein CPB83DRAFT_865356 [Crepidotus variabilis]